ncbi:MAG: YfcC family protein [Clostridia bacterium]|nr:YfcC family protein [Clostridia bacterium]
MSENEIVKTENGSESGLSLNKKTLYGIFAVLFVILIFVGFLTQIVPRGQYYTYPEKTYLLDDGMIVTLDTQDNEYKVDGGNRVNLDEYIKLISSYGTEIYKVSEPEGIEKQVADDLSGKVIDGTYHKVDYKMPVWKIIASPVLMFASDNITTGIAIILFIVLIGGTFFILDDRGVLRYIMAVIIKKFEKKKYLLLCAVIFVCMLLSSTAGILEESVTLVPIAVAVALALGWDSLVGISISLVAVAFGFTAATFNPFNVVTVQKLADIPIFSGLWLRLLVFLLVYLTLTAFVVIYAKKIEKNPQKSICYESDDKMRAKFKLSEGTEVLNDLSLKKATRAFVLFISFVLVCIVIDFAFSLNGYLSMPSMAILFTAGGIAAGYFTGLRGKDLLNGFIKGVKTIAPAIPLILFIIAITYILDKGMITHTLLNKVYDLISGLSPYSAILILFLFIAVLEFFIGSGTAKAFLIMPIVAPLASLIGISGNSVVLTFCMADGFTNLLYPTSGVMIIAIGLVNVSYGKWLKFSWKLFLTELVLAISCMHFALMIGYK